MGCELLSFIVLLLFGISFVIYDYNSIVAQVAQQLRMNIIIDTSGGAIVSQPVTQLLRKNLKYAFLQPFITSHISIHAPTRGATNLKTQTK